MIHARKDYDQIQDPSGHIESDEPVFLLRAKDCLAPATLMFWAEEVRKLGDDQLADHVEAHAKKMSDWQSLNGKKRPDVPEEAFRK